MIDMQEEEVQTICTMFLDGATPAHIAWTLGRSTSLVRDRLNRICYRVRACVDGTLDWTLPDWLDRHTAMLVAERCEAQRRINEERRQLKIARSQRALKKTHNRRVLESNTLLTPGYMQGSAQGHN